MLSQKITSAVSCALIAGIALTGCSKISTTSTSSDRDTTGASASASASASAKTGTTEKKEAAKKPEKKDTRTVEVYATATGGGTVLYGESGSTNSEKFTGEWSTTVELPKKELYSVSVSGDIFSGDDSQQVSCKIVVDGEIEEEKTGSGTAGHAFCSVSPKYF